MDSSIRENIQQKKKSVVNFKNDKETIIYFSKYWFQTHL